MKKIVVLLLLFSIIAVPVYALSLYEKLLYKEVKLDSGIVLVNRITDKVEKKLINNVYQTLSTTGGWGGIISDQEMYQAQYNKTKS